MWRVCRTAPRCPHMAVRHRHAGASRSGGAGAPPATRAGTRRLSRGPSRSVVLLQTRGVPGLASNRQVKQWGARASVRTARRQRALAARRRRGARRAPWQDRESRERAGNQCTEMERKEGVLRLGLGGMAPGPGERTASLARHALRCGRGGRGAARSGRRGVGRGSLAGLWPASPRLPRPAQPCCPACGGTPRAPPTPTSCGTPRCTRHTLRPSVRRVPGRQQMRGGGRLSG